jgi:hypothetical protein
MNDFPTITEQIYTEVSTLASQDIQFHYSEDKTIFEPAVVFPVLRSGLDPVNFVSGDVNFGDFQMVLKLCDVVHNEVFVDLGCGSGNCLLAAALSHCFHETGVSFLRVEGIELKQDKFYECKYVSARLEQIGAKLQIITPQITIKQNNFLEVDWSYAEVVYACSTCFTESVMKRLAVQFLSLKKGARVILMDKELNSDYFSTVNAKDVTDRFDVATVFQIVTQVECMTSWGKGTAFIYRRI